jgi:hypothetical protein
MDRYLDDLTSDVPADPVEVKDGLQLLPQAIDHVCLPPMQQDSLSSPTFFSTHADVAPYVICLSVSS